LRRLLIGPADVRAGDDKSSLLVVVYFRRMRGTTRNVPPVSIGGVLSAWVSAFLAIYLISIPALYPHLSASANLFLIGSFGASAALLYAAPRADLSQPRNVIGGHVLSAVIGVSVYKLVGTHVGLAAALAVSTSIVAMLITRTMHPPGAATGLIAVLGPAKVHALGYQFVLTPVLAGVVILVVVALVLNNLSPDPSRHYPASWG
jgi:CBS domain-containing membrane protein